jgi:tight adherence protein B
MIPGVFLLTWAGTLGVAVLVAWHLELQQRARVLRRVTGKEPAAREPVHAPRPLLMRVASEMQGQLANRLLNRLGLKPAAERLLETAGVKWEAAGLVHRLVAVFLLVFLLVSLGTKNSAPRLALAAAALAATLPYLYTHGKARRRVQKFEAQFPDCLEFIARSMRAGHAFSVSLEMVHREFGEPLAGEFRRTFEEQNLGQPLEIVLQKLQSRIPSMDVQFFVSAVLLQKRTGGNLVELLDRLAQIIRERFKLRARVRAISAQGILSGRILTAIPAAVAVVMFAANPQYARFFVDDPIGRKLVAAALGLQLVGYLITRKIVKIEV